MPPYHEHVITLSSFQQIDQEIGQHRFTAAEYAVVRRIIHTTADFEFKQLVSFSGDPFQAALRAFREGLPVVSDVSMVASGIGGVVAKTWQLPVAIAVQQTCDGLPLAALSTEPPSPPLPDETRSAHGLRRCASRYPGAIFAIGNAPTALLALCEGINRGDWSPAMVVGAPVGFINVVESKQMLADLQVPYILVEGRKGGSAVAAAILNALMIWAWEQLP
ncbi:MAG: precorrin-8X methylmutase [Cyanobacteria bacterium J06598_3]